MDNKECNVCKKMIKEKYKNYKLWKTLAIIFICLTVLFATLYFIDSDIGKTTIVEYDNEVIIENEGDYNTNTDNGNIVISEKYDNTGLYLFIIICIVLIGGGIIGFKVVSKKNNKDKE